MANGFLDWLTKSSERGYPSQGGPDLEWLIRSGDRGYPTTTPAPVPAPAPAPAPAVPAPAARSLADQINEMQSSVGRKDFPTPIPAPQPKSGDAVGSPIEVVRGLQRTNYLPVMDARGRVSYQSEGFIQEQAAKAAAAQKGAAETKKIEAEAAKAASVLPVAQFQEKALERFIRLQDVLDQTDRNDPSYPMIEGEYKWLASVLQPKLPGAEYEALKR